MPSERDGQVYVKVRTAVPIYHLDPVTDSSKNLAHFIRANEVALANALLSRQSAPRDTQAEVRAVRSGTLPRSAPSSHGWIESLSLSMLWRPRRLRQHTMAFNPHQLYYLLDQIGELGIHVGPLDIRSEHISASGSSANYVSFLKKSAYGGEQSDRGSIHSVSSVRSVVSSVTDLFRGSGMSKQGGGTTMEKLQAQFTSDLSYIFSAFTKIPSLRLSPIPQATLIAGYEEYPLDTAIPLTSFKNLSALEISDLDYRGFFGWHLLADSLRSLVIKRASLTDPIDLLHSIVVDDMDNRRRRSARSNPHGRSGTPTPTDHFPESWVFRGAAVSQGSPGSHDIGRLLRDQPSSTGETSPSLCYIPDSLPTRQSVVTSAPSTCIVSSPRRAKRSGSGSSNSSRASVEPFRKNSHPLLIPQTLPESKWQFLRHLGMPDNSLVRLPISCLETVHGTLQSLDLSSNLFTEMPRCVFRCTNLKALDMTNCLLDTLSSPQQLCHSLRTLSVRANRLTCDAGVAGFPSLQRLDFRDNRLTSIEGVKHMNHLKDLRELWVAQNPLTKVAGCRLSIFKLLSDGMSGQTEVILDGQGPNSAEKRSLYDGKDGHCDSTNTALVPSLRDVGRGEKEEDTAREQTNFGKHTKVTDIDRRKPSSRSSLTPDSQATLSKLPPIKHYSKDSGRKSPGLLNREIDDLKPTKGCNVLTEAQPSFIDSRQDAQATIGQASITKINRDDVAGKSEAAWLNLDSINQGVSAKQVRGRPEPSLNAVPTSIADPLLLSLRSHEVISSF